MHYVTFNALFSYKIFHRFIESRYPIKCANSRWRLRCDRDPVFERLLSLFLKFVSTGPVECYTEVLLHIKDLVINLIKLVTNRHMFFVFVFCFCLFVFIITNVYLLTKSGDFLKHM